MGRVSRGWREYDLRIRCQLDLAWTLSPVGDADSSKLDVIFRRNADLDVRVDLIVTPLELGAPLGVDRLIARSALQRRLMRGGPELAGVDIAQIAERSPAIAGWILVPTRDGEVAPAAVSPASRADRNVVSAVRKQMHFGRWCVGRGEDAIIR